MVMSKTRTGPQISDFPWYTAGNAGRFEQNLGFGRLRMPPINPSGVEISIQLQQRPNFFSRVRDVRQSLPLSLRSGTVYPSLSCFS